MLRPLVQAVGGRELDDPPEIHDRDAARQVPHHAQVVRDEQIRELEAPLQLEQEVQDLRLDRHVERRHRLVGDDELRLERERARDADALALAAAELVRVARRELGREADDLEQLAHALRERRAARQPVHAQALADRLAHRHARVQRRERVLEDDLHAAAHARAARARESRRRSRPSNAISPASGSIRRSASRASVDLPQPDSPTRPSVSPASSSRSTSVDRDQPRALARSRRGRPRNDFVSPASARSGALTRAPPAAESGGGTGL